VSDTLALTKLFVNLAETVAELAKMMERWLERQEKLEQRIEYVYNSIPEG
jgi:hypothetical protein